MTSPVKIYVDAQNQFYINSNEEPIGISKIESEIVGLIGENKAIELLADKNAHRASAYEIITYSKTKCFKSR